MPRLFLNILNGHVGSADLLGDTTRLAVLHVGAPEFVQDLRLARVDVAQHAHHGSAERIVTFVCLVFFTTFLRI